MAEFNKALDEAQRMLFRVGVHLGEVIVDDEDQNIFGDGVNLAARIQSIADPGGIAVSRTVRDMTELKVNYAFVDGGEHKLKNVSRPVHVFHVRTAAPAPVLRGVLRFEGAAAGREIRLRRGARPVDVAAAGHDDRSRRRPVRPGSAARYRVAPPRAAGVRGRGAADRGLGSTNGTSVNGAAVKAGRRMPLQGGNRLRLGDVELSIRQLYMNLGRPSRR